MPDMLLDVPTLKQRGRCGHVRPTRLPVSAGLSTLMFFRLSDCTVRRFALVKAHCNLPLPAKVIRQRRKLFLPDETLSLDNSCPPNSEDLEAEKHASGTIGVIVRPRELFVTCASCVAFIVQRVSPC